MIRRIHQLLLQLYRRLPVLPRRWIVRGIAPSYTVGSMVVIERHDGAILFVRQTYRADWGVPGGLLKRREDAADAARREVMEEVGLDIELVGPPAVVIDAVPQRVDVVYRARPAEGAQAVELSPASPEIAELAWFFPNALPELQFETTGALVELARRTREGRSRPVDLGDVAAIFRDRPAG